MGGGGGWRRGEKTVRKTACYQRPLRFSNTPSSLVEGVVWLTRDVTCFKVWRQRTNCRAQGLLFMTAFVFYQSFPLFISEIILFITIINVQGIFSPSCRLKTLAMNRVEQIMTINNIFLRANTNQAALQPTVYITLKFVSTRNLASADRLTGWHSVGQSEMLFAANLKGLIVGGFSQFRQHGYRNNFRFPFTSLLT